MKLSTAARSALTFIVVMLVLLIAGAALAVNIGPLEFLIWFVVLVVGLALIVAGTNRDRQMEK